MNDGSDQMDRLIDVLSRMHLEFHQAFVYVRENLDKWIVWLSSKGGH